MREVRFAAAAVGDESILCPNLQQESGKVDALLRKGEKDWKTAVEISVAVYYTQEYGNGVSNPEDQIIKLIEETNEGYKNRCVLTYFIIINTHAQWTCTDQAGSPLHSSV